MTIVTVVVRFPGAAGGAGVPHDTSLVTVIAQ
jgi:hypothetical protein